MFKLKLPTDPRWANIAEENINEILTDHAWCEQKAASNAISMIVRYPELSGLVAELTRIAQEELEHFGQVVEKIHARGWQLGPERKDNYVNELMQFLRKGGDRDEVIYETADLIFHLMVMLARQGIALDDICVELARRFGLSGLTEKAQRTE